VSRNLKPKTEEVQKHTAKCATKVIKNYKANSELTDEELEKELERLILQEIANTSVVPAKKNNVKKSSIKSKQVEEQYEEQEDEDEGDDDEDELDNDDDEFYK
jgi:hypothetical protein